MTQTQGHAAELEARGFETPPHPPSLRSTVSQSASGMAIAALVLGIAAWVVGGIVFSIPGWIIARMELNRIARGESPEAGKPFAQIGYWASVVHTVVFVAIMCLAAAGAVLVFFLGSARPG